MIHWSLRLVHPLNHPQQDLHTLKKCMLGSTHDVVDIEHDLVAQIEVRFSRSSHVNSMVTLSISFLVDDGNVPMKIEKNPSIQEVF